MEKAWSEALALMRKALAILDESDAPLGVPETLDLAIARLQAHVGETPTAAGEDEELS